MSRFSLSYQFRIEWTQRLVDWVLKLMHTTFISKVVGNTTLLEVVPIEEIEKAKEFMKNNLEGIGDKIDANNTSKLPTSPVAPQSATKSSKVQSHSRSSKSKKNNARSK